MEILHGIPVFGVQPSCRPHLIRKLNVILLCPASLLSGAGELRVAILHILHHRVGKNVEPGRFCRLCGVTCSHCTLTYEHRIWAAGQTQVQVA